MSIRGGFFWNVKVFRGEFIELLQKQSDLLEERKSRRGRGGGRQAESWWRSDQMILKREGTVRTWTESEQLTCRTWTLMLNAAGVRLLTLFMLLAQGGVQVCQRRLPIKHSQEWKKTQPGIPEGAPQQRAQKNFHLQSWFSRLLIGGSRWWCNINVPELPNAKPSKFQMVCAALITHQIFIWAKQQQQHQQQNQNNNKRDQVLLVSWRTKWFLLCPFLDSVETIVQLLKLVHQVTHSSVDLNVRKSSCSSHILKRNTKGGFGETVSDVWSLPHDGPVFVQSLQMLCNAAVLMLTPCRTTSSQGADFLEVALQ